MPLNNIEQLKQQDKKEVWRSLEFFGDQVRQVIDDSLNIHFSADYAKVNNIVVHGMGGSNLGAHITRALFADTLKVPLMIVDDYTVPAFVNEKTLYILSSYSGNTEEVLSVYDEVQKRGAKMAAITAVGGGKLEQLMLDEDIPGYIFDTKFNPCGLPRVAVGYAVMGIAALLARVGFLSLNIDEMRVSVDKLEVWTRRLRLDEPMENNPAKTIANQLHGKMPLILAAEFLSGNLQAMRNQFCESAKNFAGFLVLPDMNHFALEGMTFPKSNSKNLVVVYFHSNLYSDHVIKRARITKEVFTKNNIPVFEYCLTGATKIEQSLEMLQFGGYLSYYLGLLNGVDPAITPWVDYLKGRMG